MEPYEYLIYGETVPTVPWEVLAHSRHFLSEMLTTLLPIPVDPFADGVGALAMTRQDAETLLLTYRLPTRVTYVRVPLGDIRGLKGDLKPIVRLMKSDLSQAVPLVTSTRWTFEIRREALYKALDIVSGQMPRLLALLSGMLTPQGLAVLNGPSDVTARFQLMQGLLLLIASPVRHEMTFSMNSLNAPPASPRLVFLQGTAATQRRVLVWDDSTPTAAASDDDQPYVRYLATHWHGDLDAFVRVLMALDKVAYSLPLTDNDLPHSLNAVAQQAITQPDTEQPLATAALVALLEDAGLDDDTRDHYLNQLLQRALEDRDGTASHWLALQMDTDAVLNARFGTLLDTLAETQPDAVYAFARAHLTSGGDGVRWLPRLHSSARRAFALVLESTDSSSIMSWLQLLAREPEAYAMDDIVHDVILAAVPLAYTNPTLARDLLIRAVKREPSVLVALLDDELFCAVLPVTVQQALFDQQAQAIETLVGQSRELFLLALARVLGMPASVSMTLVSALWELYISHSTLVMAEPYQPITLIRRLIGSDRAALQEGMLGSLLGAMVEDQQDDLFFEAAALLALEEALTPVLAVVLRDSQRPMDDVVNLISRLSSSGSLNPQATVNLYVALLDYQQWDEKTMTPMIEQLARLVCQPNEVRVPSHALWHLIEGSSGAKTDLLCKGAVKRLLNTIIQYEPDEQFVKDLVRLKKATQKQPVARLQMQNWWRDYTHVQTTPQLHRLEKTLDGQRSLDDLRASLATYMGVRKQFATRSLKEWSDDISTTYRVLKTLSEGFDPSERTGSIDVSTLQRMIEASVQDWPSDQKYILAANLRDLAELLPTMADVRTKPSIMRSDDLLERQLMAGDVPPQSAVDVMRWLAGYLDGAQKNGV